jgi:hypothetical protein
MLFVTCRSDSNLRRNKYYTPFGNCSVNGNKNNPKGTPIDKLQGGGVEAGSTCGMLPSNDLILKWGRAKLGM